MTARRRFRWACAAGGTPALAVFAWLLTSGTGSLLAWHPTADFYDAQAHALLGGHLDVPTNVLGIEAFLEHGKAYMYQGPFPALLRLPIAAVTHSYDGRLAAVSMLLAMFVAVVATSSLLWQVRSLVRGEAPVGPREAVAVGGFVFACTGGAVLLFEASQVSVYHESALWGAAAALATLAALLRHLTAPGRGTLALASVLAGVTLCSRASVGLGLIGALGLVALRDVGRAARAARAGEERRPAARRAGAAVLACLAPMLFYGAINVAKFGTVLDVPWGDQQFATVSSARRDFLASNHGTFLGLKFLPTTAVAYLRPDAFSIGAEYPWIGFRTASIAQPTGYGDVVLDKVDATGSIPVSLPLLTILGAVGIVVVIRRRRTLAPLVIPLVGAAAAATTIFAFGFIAQRYLADAMPFMVLAAAVGFVAVVEAAGRRGALARRAAAATFIVVGLLSAWVNVAEGVWYQRVYASPSDADATLAFYQHRADLPTLPGGSQPAVQQGDHLPARAPATELFVVGDCAGLYVSDGSQPDELSHTSWKPVARTPALGAFDADVVFPDAPAGTSDPLLVSGTAAAPNIVAVDYLGDGQIQLRFTGAGIPGPGATFTIEPGRAYHLEAVADPETDLLTVALDGRVRFSTVYTADDIARLGVNDLDTTTNPTFGGTLTERPESKDLCRSVLASR